MPKSAATDHATVMNSRRSHSHCKHNEKVADGAQNENRLGLGPRFLIRKNPIVK
jgi:hypothetical protein